MRKPVIPLSILRRPISSALLMLLMCAMSFSFIARAVEYITLNREIGRISEFYRAIGTLDNRSGGNVTDGVPIVESSLALAFSDALRVSPAVLQDLHNADVDGRSSDYPDSPIPPSGLHISDIFVYGTVQTKEISEKTVNFKIPEKELYIDLKIDNVEAGYPEYVQNGKTIRIIYRNRDDNVFTTISESFEVGQRYFVRAYYHPDSKSLILNPTISDEKEIEITKQNQRAVLLIGTKDMSSLPRVQPIYPKEGRHYLVDGRWLDKADDTNENKVCVIRQEFAELRGLSIGDTITMTMRDLKNLVGGHILPGEDWDNWKDYKSYTETFEVVGVYNVLTMSITGLTSRNNSIFIPNSAMPAEYGNLADIYQESYSFVLKSPMDIQVFTNETLVALSAIGINAVFMDTGWESFYAPAESLLRSVMFSALLFGLLIIFTLCLVVFIYLRGQRRNFAVMRVLGVPNRTAVCQALGTIMSMGIISIVSGGVLSWGYALSTATKTLASFNISGDIKVSAALSPMWLVVLCTGFLALLSGFALAGTLILAKRPVLELLHNKNLGVRNPAKSSIEAVNGKPNSLLETKLVRPEAITSNPQANYGFAQSTRFMFRHIVRVPVKTFLLVALPVCFIIAISWINRSIVTGETEVYHLYETTVVSGDIVKGNTTTQIAGEGGGFIRNRTIEKLINTDYLSNMVAEATAEGVVYRLQGDELQLDRVANGVFFRGFDNPQSFLMKSGKNVIIEYGDDWNESVFAMAYATEQELLNSSGPMAVLPDGMMERLNINTGDRVAVKCGDKMYTFTVVGRYFGAVLGDISSDTVLMPLSVLSLLKFGDPLYISAEFTIDTAYNHDLDAFRDKVNGIVSQPGAGLTDLSLLLWDSELTKVVEPIEKNIELMKLLYPITIAVTALIAIAFSLLLIIQRSKEIAIMRVLGVTRTRVRITLMLEQVLLCAIGLAIGFVVSGYFSESISAELLFGGFYYLLGVALGAFLGVLVTVKNKPLELLQEKE